MKFLNGLLIGIIFGVVGYWVVQNKIWQHPESPVIVTRPSTNESSSHLSETFKAKMEALDLRAEEIKDELARTGKVVRRKAHDLGEQVADATADARTVASIKATYAVDPNLSVWQISVSCTQGHVTLSGMVSTPDDLGRAVAVALGVDGVRDVSSTLQVKSNL